MNTLMLVAICLALYYLVGVLVYSFLDRDGRLRAWFKTTPSVYVRTAGFALWPLVVYYRLWPRIKEWL